MPHPEPTRARRRLQIPGFVHATVDLVYPPCCPSCAGLPGEGSPHSLCRRCLKSFKPVRAPFCDSCGEPYPPGATSAAVPAFTCANCDGVDLAFDFARAAYLNTGRLRLMILRFKYDSRLALRLPLAHLANHAFATDPRLAGRDDWLVVPVPVHFWRRLRRQFNQAEELARIVAALRGLDFANPLRRTRYTPPQANLDRAARLHNLSAAFRLHKPARAGLDGRHVLLVDDVLTTGSTASACAHVLKANAAPASVAVLTIARG